MSRKRRKLGAALKAKVAIAAVKGDKTTAQLASEFGIHTSQVTAWKKRLSRVDGAEAEGSGRGIPQRLSPSDSVRLLSVRRSHCGSPQAAWITAPSEPRDGGRDLGNGQIRVAQRVARDPRFLQRVDVVRVA